MECVSYTSGKQAKHRLFPDQLVVSDAVVTECRKGTLDRRFRRCMQRRVEGALTGI
ncbi:hypothetical protein GBAR_LOCUS9042, partial [Geodia barretti]